MIFSPNSICSVGVNERSALRDLRERLFYHREELVAAFKKYDDDNTGWTELFVNYWHLSKH